MWPFYNIYINIESYILETNMLYVNYISKIYNNIHICKKLSSWDIEPEFKTELFYVDNNLTFLMISRAEKMVVLIVRKLRRLIFIHGELGWFEKWAGEDSKRWGKGTANRIKRTRVNFYSWALLRTPLGLVLTNLAVITNCQYPCIHCMTQL